MRKFTQSIFTFFYNCLQQSKQFKENNKVCLKTVKRSIKSYNFSVYFRKRF